VTTTIKSGSGWLRPRVLQSALACARLPLTCPTASCGGVPAGRRATKDAMVESQLALCRTFCVPADAPSDRTRMPSATLQAANKSAMSRLWWSPRLYRPPPPVGRFAAIAAAISASSSSCASVATAASASATDADDDKAVRISAARSSLFAVSAGPCTHGGHVKVVAGASGMRFPSSKLSQRGGTGITASAMAAAAAEETDMVFHTIEKLSTPNSTSSRRRITSGSRKCII